MAFSVRTSDARTLGLLDALVATWFVLWLVVGSLSGVVMWHFSETGDTLTTSGQAIGSAGNALQSLDALPVIGDRPAEVGRETAAAGADITARGHEVKRQLRQLSLLLGLSIGLIPTAPVVGLYLPLRVSRRREVRQIRASLAAHRRDDGLDRYLADRALRILPYAEVRSLVSDPGPPLGQEDARVLADAELARLGLSRP